MLCSANTSTNFCSLNIVWRSCKSAFAIFLHFTVLPLSLREHNQHDLLMLSRSLYLWIFIFPIFIITFLHPYYCTAPIFNGPLYLWVESKMPTDVWYIKISEKSSRFHTACTTIQQKCPARCKDPFHRTHVFLFIRILLTRFFIRNWFIRN